MQKLIKAGVAILISDKVEKENLTDREGHYINVSMHS